MQRRRCAPLRRRHRRYAIRCGSTTTMRASRRLPRPHSAADIGRLGAIQHQGKARRLECGCARSTPSDSRCRVNYTNVRNAGSETEWLQPVYPGEPLSSQSCLVDIIARQGRAGLGIYITEEEQILNSGGETVMRRRHTMALFPEAKLAGRSERIIWLGSSKLPISREPTPRACSSKAAMK